MSDTLILASGSAIRSTLLTNAHIPHEVIKPKVDEDMIRMSLAAEDAKPRDIADTLAEFKARKVSERVPGAFVLGCDQVLEFEGDLLSKPKSPDQLREQLQSMRGKRHTLLSAAVICQDGKPIWRHIGMVRMMMRAFSDTYMDTYIARNWDDIRHCVGGYQLEGEGLRLFSRIEGDYFNVLGLPMMEIQGYLTIRGIIEG